MAGGACEGTYLCDGDVPGTEDGAGIGACGAWEYVLWCIVGYDCVVVDAVVCGGAVVGATGIGAGGA